MGGRVLSGADPLLARARAAVPGGPPVISPPGVLTFPPGSLGLRSFELQSLGF